MRQIIFCFALLLLSLGSPTAANAYYNLGIIDRSGKEVVPCRYHQIEYLGHGLFLLERLNPVNPVRRSFDALLVDSDGREIPAPVPNGCTLSKVYLPNLPAETANIHVLPQGSYSEFHGKNGLGLCDSTGKILLEPKYAGVGPPNGKYFPVFEGALERHHNLSFVLDISKGTHVTALAAGLNDRGMKDVDAHGTAPTPTPFDLPKDVENAVSFGENLFLCEERLPQDESKNKHYRCVDKNGQTLFKFTGHRAMLFDFGLAVVATKVPNEESWWQVIDRHGNIVQKLQPSFFTVPMPDRLIKYERQQHFNSIVWTFGASHGSIRTEQFGYFLKDYNLIGMPRAEVEDLLGRPIGDHDGRARYTLTSGPCGNSWTGIDILYSADKAKAWRYAYASRSSYFDNTGQWIDTNVLIDMSIPELGENRSRTPYPKPM